MTINELWKEILLSLELNLHLIKITFTTIVVLSNEPWYFKKYYVSLFLYDDFNL